MKTIPTESLVDEIEIDLSGGIPSEVLESTTPLILRGALSTWPLVEVGKQSPSSTVKYLKSHYNGQSAGAYFAKPEVGGRFFYNEDLSALNFEIKSVQLDAFLDTILSHINDTNPPGLYIASNRIDQHFPSLGDENQLPLKHNRVLHDAPFHSIWIGNKTLVSCHFDAFSNIACCAVGQREFTLFPPDQIDNLYPGPLTPTPGGQIVSMVDFKQPDLSLHPNFELALQKAQVARLEAGDAIVIPTMWWHQVEALSKFNVLVNYWWTYNPKFMGQGMEVLLHALLSLRDQSEQEKVAWQHIFNYYIFSDKDKAKAHIPAPALGLLDEPSDMKARQLKAMILRKLNR
jgi:hypothetical protein